MPSSPMLVRFFLEPLLLIDMVVRMQMGMHGQTLVKIGPQQRVRTHSHLSQANGAIVTMMVMGTISQKEQE